MDHYDQAGPTPERLLRSQGFYTEVGRAKSSKRFTMQDDTLGRSLMRRKITPSEYQALRLYALHWLAGGLQGHLGSVDLNRVLAFNPVAMTGLCKTEAQADHRRLYRAARDHIGMRPALVADAVACFDLAISTVGIMLGYRSRWHGRAKAFEILSDAGYRLGRFWDQSH